MIKIEKKNYGYIPSEITPENYILGGFTKVPEQVVNPTGDWLSAISTGEPQKRNIDTFSCVSFGALNQIEALMKYKFGLEVNYSDRFLAKVSGTIRGKGNDPQKVYEAIRKFGCVPESLYPFIDGMTEDEFFAEIPQSVLEQGKKWLEIWDFKHEWIYTDNTPLREKQEAIKKGLLRSPVAVPVAAWFERNGKYYKPDNENYNHWVGGIIVGYVDQKSWLVSDSYPESEGDFIKELEWDYNFGAGKIIYLDKKLTLAQSSFFLDWLKKLWVIFFDIKRQVDNLEKPKPPEVVIPVEKKSRVEDFALAIRSFEGWDVGTRSHRNNNTGNLKFTDYTKSLGAIGRDKDNFCIFKDYTYGFVALCQFIRDAGNNLLKDYKDCTIESFFKAYSDNSARYAWYIAKMLGVSVNLKVADLL